MLFCDILKHIEVCVPLYCNIQSSC